MKKIIALMLTLLCIFSLAACGSSDADEPASNRLEATSASLKKDLPEKLDLSDLDLLSEEDASAENLLFIYGIDSGIRETVDSYFITNSHRSTDPRAIAILFFKDSENVKEDIAAAKKGIEDVFLKTLVNATATYDPEAAKTVNSAIFKEYDNALVFISYDTEGNSQVIDAIEGK